MGIPTTNPVTIVAKEGVLNLIAHMLTLKYGLDGDGLPITAVQQEVTSKSIGKISKGMGSKNSDIYAGAGDYASTVYGRRYWELLRLIKPTGIVFGGSYEKDKEVFILGIRPKNY